MTLPVTACESISALGTGSNTLQTALYQTATSLYQSVHETSGKIIQEVRRSYPAELFCLPITQPALFQASPVPRFDFAELALLS
jgi:hypothetical protein